MSCACEHKKLGQEIERIRRLAKGYAEMEGVTVALFRNADGTFGFCSVNVEIEKEIVEYITPY